MQCTPGLMTSKIILDYSDSDSCISLISGKDINQDPMHNSQFRLQNNLNSEFDPVF